MAAALGCAEDGPKLLPVKGKVTFDGKLAEEGGVSFHQGMQQLVGAILPDGSYSIMFNRESGAPLGKYKVTVAITKTPKDAQGNPAGLPSTISGKKYLNVATTPLEIDVVESPDEGAYDLKVTR